jgi:hypothetical protein
MNSSAILGVGQAPETPDGVFLFPCLLLLPGAKLSDLLLQAESHKT